MKQRKKWVQWTSFQEWTWISTYITVSVICSTFGWEIQKDSETKEILPGKSMTKYIVCLMDKASKQILYKAIYKNRATQNSLLF